MSEIAVMRPDTTARWARGTGRRVRGRLAESEKSQEQAAQALGLSQAAMSRRLAGKVDFTISELLDLSEWLGVPLEELLPREATTPRVKPAQTAAGLDPFTPRERRRERRHRIRTSPKLPRPVFGRTLVAV